LPAAWISGRGWPRCSELYRYRTWKNASLAALQLEAIGSVKQRDAQRLVEALRATRRPSSGDHGCR